MRRYLMYIITVLLVALGCAGQDEQNKDKIPPTKPVLHHHIGDLGDVESITQLPIEGVDGNDINDFNNGIDALHGPNNDIRLQWDHLVDNDLDFVNIYRYSFYDEVELINTITPSVDEFIDRNLTTYRKYSYYLEVFDVAGNSTMSDTVSYKLYNKAQLVSPVNETTSNNLSELSFRWNEAGVSETVDFYRVVLYRDVSNDNYSEYEIVWSYDEAVTDQENFEINYSALGGDLSIPNGTYYWRVDAFTYNSETNAYFGSESVEYRLYIYQ